MTLPELRLRTPTADLLALPWERPLDEWTAPDVPLRELPVGPSRHLVKFVECDGALWAVKDLPPRIAEREYAVLGRLEELGLPAVRRAGLVRQPAFDTALLLTRYLDSWQYRRLFRRLPPDQPAHRARLYDAMANLLVELHRHGVFWGDCSLANTLFSRDGQVLQAWLVDAETSEVHPSLSNGQREHDLQILVENVAADLLDLVAWLGREELEDTLIAEAQDIPERYQRLWQVLHAAPVFGFTDRYRVEGTIRRLNDLGFAVEEVTLRPDDAAVPERLRLNVVVGDRRFHAERLRELTGMDVGEGQARVLLGDLFTYRTQLCREAGYDVDDSTAAQLWVREVALPTMHRAHAAIGGTGTAIQAFCDLLEIRWLLSERAGHDVGTERALAALARDHIPTDSAAKLAVAEVPTQPMPVLEDDD
jgi:hypothetical protein